MSDNESKDRQPQDETPNGIMADIQQMESAFNSLLRQVTSRVNQLTELVLSEPSRAETQKGRTAKGAESPKSKSFSMEVHACLRAPPAVQSHGQRTSG